MVKNSNRKTDGSMREVGRSELIKELLSMQEENPNRNITRTYYRKHGTYSCHLITRLFGNFTQFKRDAGLQSTRETNRLLTRVTKEEDAVKYQEFFTKEVLPFVEKYPKKITNKDIVTMLVASDAHDLESDKFSIDVFIDTCKRLQPDIICLNGDILDLYEFSRFTADPRKTDIVARFAWLDNFLARLRRAAPDAQIDYIIGNHEFRLLRYLADKSPEMRILLGDIMEMSLKDIFGLDKHQVNFVSKFDLSAFTAKEVKNAAKRNYKIYEGCYAVSHEPDSSLLNMNGTNGHLHKIDVKHNSFVDPATGLSKPVTWVTTPAMCSREAEYVQRASRWQCGFLQVFIDKRTKESYHNIIETTYGWCVVNGMYYSRKDA